MPSLDEITLRGFKSIRNLEKFPLSRLNILIGGNGAGKSNFLEFFRLLRAMMELPLPDLVNSSLKAYVADSGSCDDFLFNGPKVTSQIESELHFGSNGYRFTLVPTSEEMFTINNEERLYKSWGQLESGPLMRPALLKDKDKPGRYTDHNVSWHIYDSIKSWKLYHFHDTSKLAPMRRSAPVDDNEYLRFDASNIAPFLLNLRDNHKASYDKIVDVIRLVTPFFDDFILKTKNDKVRLMWHQKGSDFPLKPAQLSDGTIRFICLATALLQPQNPSTMIFDEPELGLHPFAIEILAELFTSISEHTQIIVSTQSPALVDYFDAQDVVIIDRQKGESVFHRLNAKELSDWLQDYSLGELWRKNVIGGGPSYE